MKKFLKILLVNYIISLGEAVLFALAIWARTGTWGWDGIISNVFTLTQTLFITVKYLVATGEIEIKWKWKKKSGV